MNDNANFYFRVGIFALIALVVSAFLSYFVNDRPYWWNPCQRVYINVEDATGLKTKSPIRSLGLQVGYLNSVELTETYVRLGICLTAPVEVLPNTRAYIRGEGFLGDKFVELKPMRYVGSQATQANGKANDLGPAQVIPTPPRTPSATSTPEPAFTQRPSTVSRPRLGGAFAALLLLAGSERALAAPTPVPGRSSGGGRDIPIGDDAADIGKVINRVDSLVEEVTALTKNLKEGISPEDLKRTFQQLNKTLQGASETLSPRGQLTVTAQRTLANLEQATSQLKDLMSKVNEGKGTIGILLNDPTIAEELRQAIRNANALLGKASTFRFIVDVGAEHLKAYDGTRAWIRLGIWPRADRYYLLGVTMDPRGRLTTTSTTTSVGGSTTTTQTSQTERGGLLFTAMLGKVFWSRVDLSLGVLHGDGTVTAKLLLGPSESENAFEIHADGYGRSKAGTFSGETQINSRFTALLRPFSTVYVRGGLEGVRLVNGKLPWAVGAGISFDDEDIKLLFALR